MTGTNLEEALSCFAVMRGIHENVEQKMLHVLDWEQTSVAQAMGQPYQNGRKNQEKKSALHVT